MKKGKNISPAEATKCNYMTLKSCGLHQNILFKHLAQAFEAS